MNTVTPCPYQTRQHTLHLQRQSLRLEQAVSALRTVSDMASALQAKSCAGASASEIGIDGLAGLFDILATAVEAPLKELDGVIGCLEVQARSARPAGPGGVPTDRERPNDAI